MTIYAGETVTFKTSATKVDDAKTVVLNTDVTSTEIVIVDANGATVVAATPMTWDATDQEWRYEWDTATDGRYLARLRLIGATFDTWEFKRVVVRANLSPFTPP